MYKPTFNSALLFILFIALIVRSVNPTFGSPVLYVIPDEVPNYLAAFEMIAFKTAITSSQYPPLGSYILIPFYGLTYFFMRLTQIVSNLSQFELYLLTHEGFLLFIPRLISAVFGTVSLLVVYKLALLLFPKNRNAAFWAMLLTAFSITHVQLSHIGKPWLASQFFYLWGIYWYTKFTLLDKFLRLNSFITIIFFVIALGFHFSAVYGVMLLILIFLLLKDKVKFKSLLFIKTLIIAGISISSIFIYQNFLMSYKYQTGEFNSILESNLRTGLINKVWFYMKEFVFTEPVIILFLMFSLIYIRRWPKILYAFIFYSVIYFFIISLTFYQSLRYLLPILPLLSMPAGFAINEIQKRMRPYLKFIFTLLILSFTVFPSLLWLQRFLQKPTFIDSQKWVNTNIPVSTSLAINAVRFSPFVPNQEAANLLHKYKPLAWSKLSKFNPDLYPETVRNAIYLEVVTDVNNQHLVRDFMKLHQIRFLVQVYWDPNGSYYLTQNDNWKLAAHFTPRYDKQNVGLINLLHGSANLLDLLPIQKFGPYIDILEINADG